MSKMLCYHIILKSTKRHCMYHINEKIKVRPSPKFCCFLVWKASLIPIHYQINFTNKNKTHYNILDVFSLLGYMLTGIPFLLSWASFDTKVEYHQYHLYFFIYMVHPILLGGFLLVCGNTAF